MIGKIFNKALTETARLYIVLRNYKFVKKAAKASVLSDENINRYTSDSCPVCMSNGLRTFAKFPLNVPAEQNHSLLYFDYENDVVGLGNINPEDREVLDKALGFFISTSWEFCDNCKNASLASQFNSEHMLQYYRDFYTRGKKVDKLRRNTKELHGKYVDSLLSSKSRVFEIGAADGVAAEYLARQGHDVFVYEPSGEFSEKLKNYAGLTYINDLHRLNGSLNVIYLHHVLEHISDPVEYIKGLLPLLKKEGFLLIQVPDLSLQMDVLAKVAGRSIYSLFNKPYFSYNALKSLEALEGDPYFWFDALANDHISAFTPEGLTYVLNKAGFESVNIIRSTSDKITCNIEKYSWPVDELTGNTPNGITALVKKLI